MPGNRSRYYTYTLLPVTKKCPHCSCLQPNGTFLDLFRKLDFLRNEPLPKVKNKTESEPQSLLSKKADRQETSSILAMFTARKSLKKATFGQDVFCEMIFTNTFYLTIKILDMLTFW